MPLTMPVILGSVRSDRIGIRAARFLVARLGERGIESNTLDHFLEEYSWRPSAICCYSAGQYGGVRAAMPLRAMLAEMGMSSIPSLLPIPRLHKALDEAGVPAEDWLGRAAGRFLDELVWYAEALRARRGTGTPY